MGRMAQTGQREIAIDARLAFGAGPVSVNLTAQPLFGPDGAPIGSMLVFEDITVTRDGLKTTAQAAYTQPVEVFPNYKYPITFSFTVEGINLGQGANLGGRNPLSNR